MPEKANRRMALICSVLFSMSAMGGGIQSPFNNLPVPSDTIPASYSFILTGHLHGASTNVSGFPASSILASIDTLNNLSASFFVSLGDLFMELNEENITHYRYALFNKLKMPIFNVPGNHDVRHELYIQHFGKTFFFFILGTEAFIFFDTELDDGSIAGEQMDLLKKTIDIIGRQEKIKNIFIFSHRPIWAENNPRYAGLFAGNTRTLIGKNNFETDVRPLIETLAKNKVVYWCSGSLAASSVSFFYDTDETGIHFINTGIRDEPKDGILLVTCNKGNISFTTISLTGNTMQPLEEYNLSFWKAGSAFPPSSFNYRLLPYLIKQAVMHPYFWYGFFACFILLGIIYSSVMVWYRRKW